MGNQASRVIRDAKKRKDGRRRSTATLGAQSHTSQGNYNWIEENQATALSAGAISAAMVKAAAPSHTDPAPTTPRRKSITEFFLPKRKLSFSSTSRPSEDDLREYDRLQRQHYLLKSARKSNTWAPLHTQEPTTIVDVGTGNGIWALEMAAQYPNSQVIALDRRLPVDSSSSSGPKNLRYVKADIHETWPMADHAVDFIFMRNMSQHIRQDQWSPLLREMARVLKPGGYIEVIEPDPVYHNPGPVQQAFESFTRNQWSDDHLDFAFADTLSDVFESLGFQILEKRLLDIPIGEWPEEPELKQFGFINKQTQKAFLKNRKSELVSRWGIPSEDYDLAVQEILEEFEEYHSFSRFTCWVVQKPFSSL